MKATRIVSSVVCVFLYATLIRSNTYRAFADTSNIACSGECGENAVWELDKNGTLTISGFGAMYDYPCIYLEIETYNRNAALSGVFGGEKYDPVDVTTIMVKDGITEVSCLDGLNTKGLMGDHWDEQYQGIDITLSDSVTIINSGAFQATNIRSISFPKNLTVIGSNAFYQCNMPKHLELPNSMTCIGSGAFNGCMGIETIKFPNNLETIQSNAFSNTRIQDIVIPQSVKSIESGALSGCSKVTLLNSRCLLDDIFKIGQQIVYSGPPVIVVGYDNSTAYEFVATSKGSVAIDDYGSVKVVTPAPQFSFESIGKDYTLGDITCDGEVGLKDAVLLAKAISGNYQLTAEQKLQADIDWDHKVNDADLTYLLKRLAGDEDW